MYQEEPKKTKLQKAIIFVLVLLCLGTIGFTIYHFTTHEEIFESAIGISTGVNYPRIPNAYFDSNLSDGKNNIIAKGNYHLTGSVEGYIHVNSDGPVNLILDNVSIANTLGPAIYIESNETVVITLIGKNELISTPTSEENGAIYSKADLIFISDASDEGSLTIESTIDGIVGKDDLQIESGSYTIYASDDGIVGKDSLKIIGGTFDIAATGNGLKTSNDIEKGDLEITDGAFILNTVGKGIKSERNLEISGGVFEINSADDAVHSNKSISVLAGVFTINTSDDAFHADDQLIIGTSNNDALRPTIVVEQSNEALEANKITINNGDLNLTGANDGINAMNSNGSNTVGKVGDGEITINGGNLYIASNGDGLDSNGSITINGGVITIDGPTSDNESPLDCDGKMTINGGELFIVGSSGMVQTANEASQPVLLFVLTTSYNSEEVILKNSMGMVVYSGSPKKSYKSILISRPDLKIGDVYTLFIDNKSVATIELSQNIATFGTIPGAGPIPGGGGGQQHQGRSRGGRW